MLNYIVIKYGWARNGVGQSRLLSSKTQEELKLGLLAHWCKPNFVSSVHTLFPEHWSSDSLEVFILTSPHPSVKVICCLGFDPASQAVPSSLPVTVVTGGGEGFDSYTTTMGSLLVH